MNKCYFCKGKTKIKNLDVDFRWEGKLFVVKNVPVEVCLQCGERYYSAIISKKLDNLVKKQELEGKEFVFSGNIRQNKVFNNLELSVSNVEEIDIDKLISELEAQRV